MPLKQIAKLLMENNILSGRLGEGADLFLKYCAKAKTLGFWFTDSFFCSWLCIIKYYFSLCVLFWLLCFLLFINPWKLEMGKEA